MLVVEKKRMKKSRVGKSEEEKIILLENEEGTHLRSFHNYVSTTMITRASLLLLGLVALTCLSTTGDAFRSSSSKFVRLSASSREQPRALSMTGPVAWVAAVPIMYGLMSINEYVTHRYYQHGPADFDKKFLGGKNVHVEHHAEALDDMSLKTDETWMNSPAAKKLIGNEYRGTAFTYRVTALMLAQMIPSAFPIYHFMGFSSVQTLCILLPSILLHAAVWNTIHPGMHGLHEVPVSVGVPSAWLNRFKDSWFFRFLYRNHEGHHVLGGQCNYNVCCPGADFLFGTYVKEADWRPKMKYVDPNRQTSKSTGAISARVV